MKQVFVNIKPGGLRTSIKPVRNIDFSIFDIWSPETPNFRGKPIEGGLWTTDDGYTWIDHIINNLKDVPSFEEKLPKELGNWELYYLTAKNPNVYVVDSKADYAYLRETFLLERNLLFNYLNWEELSKKYDGIKLTDKGISETRSDLFGWEIPQTLWFNWVFEKHEEPERIPLDINDFRKH
ncbi:hypothetical protein M3612_25215 [Niallia taxi]|uniref:hypothetical protein n=1 Tax=Niallia taxi TaxID=2499688 RepID=UPI00203CB2AC|nr:hypothetical protein [Niallia taxi]MCM3217774.1 hypothetical protein [Niallia taxi]